MTPNIGRDYEIRETMTTSAHEVQAQAQRVVKAARHLFVTGVMSHGGHANLSARLDVNRFLLTTIGCARVAVRPDGHGRSRREGPRRRAGA